MAQLHQGILGVIALIGGFGAVQLALGSDLNDQSRGIESAVNREAKSDRTAASRNVEGRTIAVRLDDRSSSSILMRIAPSGEARRIPISPIAPNMTRKTMVACEPVVSVLTDIAKQLQPGRCVT
jgi:hypothetical protein